MIHRFTGDTDRETLIDTLLRQEVIQGDRALAEQLAEVGEIVAFDLDALLAEQGGTDDWSFFVLSGSVGVHINGHHIAVREHGTVVGEMAAIDPSAPRSATLKAAAPTVALRVTRTGLATAAEVAPELWLRLARLGMERLRQRSRWHRTPNERPILFVGSSVEGLRVAEQILLGLKHSGIVVRLWTARGVFGPSGISVDDLLEQVDEADFAAFVFGPDDTISSRDLGQPGPRDNVVFELGLFMGRLGRRRVFMVKAAAGDLKIPSDLLGVAPITYEGGSLATSIGPAIVELKLAIESQGVIRNKMGSGVGSGSGNPI